MIRLLKSAGIPQRFLQADLENFKTKYTIPDDSTGFYIHGPRGVGKTHLLAAIIKQKIRDHLKANNGDIGNRHIPAFISVPELLFKFKQSYSKTSNTTEDEILKKYTNANILALDDLGAERSRKDWSVPLLYLLIDRRYAAMKQTFFSSNLNLDEISTQLDDRISSRISGMCEIIKIEGKDKRLRI